MASRMRGAMNDDKKIQDAKAEAERLIEDLFGLATRSLERGNLSQDDDQLGLGKLFLATGSRELMGIVGQSNSGAAGYEAITRTIRGAALIGSTAIFTKKYFLARQKVKRGRDAKRIKDGKRKQDLDDAIVAEALEQGRTLYISEKFAKQVGTGVAKRLAPDSPPSDPPAKPLTLSDTAIKNAVRRILKKGQVLKSCP
jgi:hypothetical protein